MVKYIVIWHAPSSDWPVTQRQFSEWDIALAWVIGCYDDGAAGSDETLTIVEL